MKWNVTNNTSVQRHNPPPFISIIWEYQKHTDEETDREPEPELQVFTSVFERWWGIKSGRNSVLKNRPFNFPALEKRFQPEIILIMVLLHLSEQKGL